MAVEPARALASSRRTAQAAPQANRATDPVVLAPGSGYGGGKDAALVRSLQRRLEAQGYSPGPVDGRYGPRTETAVETFQSARGLRVDGRAGPLTLTALHTTVLYPGTGYAGAGSSKVRRLQRQLRRDGVNPGPIDGRYGPLTEGAVRRFQEAHGLHVDGIAGPHTFGELTRLAAGRPTASSRPKTPSRPKAHPAPPHPPRKLHPKPSHPTVPQPAQPAATAPAHQGRTSRPNGTSWPVALVVVGLLCLAALVSGVWLVARRRRAAKAAVQPAVVDPVASGPASSRTPEYGEAAELDYRSADQRGDAVAASNLGVILERRGDLAGAEAAYRRADARGSAEGAFNLAGLLLERGDADAGMAALHRADLRGDAAAAATLGLLLVEKGDEAGACDAYSRADERGDAGAAVNLGVLLERRGDLAGAEAAYRRADARGSADGAYNLGGLYSEHGDPASAADAYERADQRGDPKAAARLGMLLERHGDYHSALEAYQRAQRSRDPEIAELARSRAQALAFGLSVAEKGHQ